MKICLGFGRCSPVCCSISCCETGWYKVVSQFPLPLLPSPDKSQEDTSRMVRLKPWAVPISIRGPSPRGLG